MAQESDYPVQYSIDYPESCNRITVLFRLILAVPILFLSGLLMYSFVADVVNGVLGVISGDLDVISGVLGFAPTALAIALFVATLLMILFRKKYPRWWFDFGLELRRFSTRVGAYLAMMQDAYPSTDEQQSVHLDIEYPENLSRWMPLVKWILAIPHYIVLAVLGIAASVVLLIVWFAILFTGRYPRSLFDFLVGFGRWWTRVEAYMFMLATDRYPPFRLSP